MIRCLDIRSVPGRVKIADSTDRANVRDKCSPPLSKLSDAESNCFPPVQHGNAWELYRGTIAYWLAILSTSPDHQLLAHASSAAWMAF
jgi:hypothetical protein